MVLNCSHMRGLFSPSGTILVLKLSRSLCFAKNKIHSTKHEQRTHVKNLQRQQSFTNKTWMSTVGSSVALVTPL